MSQPGRREPPENLWERMIANQHGSGSECAAHMGGGRTLRDAAPTVLWIQSLLVT